MTIKQIMRHLGFNHIEYEVYCLLLQNGGATSQQIESKHSDISKLQIQSTLHQLIQKKFIYLQTNNEIRKYYAETPASIVLHIERSLNEQMSYLGLFKKNQSELEGIMPDEKPVVRFYEGKDGVLSMLDEFNRAEHKEEALLVYNPEDVNGFFTPEEKNKQRSRRIGKNISTKAIYCETKNSSETNELSELRKVDKNKFLFESDVTLFDDKLMIASLSSPVMGIIIQDKKIVRTFKSLFNLAYEQAGLLEKESDKSG